MADTFAVDPVSGKSYIVKDPNAVLDYVFDWTAYLAPIADTIASTSFFAEGAVVASSSATQQIASAWVSGGVAGTTVALTCRIVTAGGRTDERTAYLKIRER